MKSLTFKMDTLKGNFDARFNTLLSHFMVFLSTDYSWHQLKQTFFCLLLTKPIVMLVE